MPSKHHPSSQWFADKLLAWHKTIHRPFPWKGEKNPYLIWLSEIILQQTRVEQGLPYYLKFKEHFPDVKQLANADEDKVLRLWQGLGYYTRARNLHAAAKYIYKELNGNFPADYAGIKKLKGVGDYTAAAIASFAYDLPYAVVDGNVFRALSRCFGIKTPIDTTKGKQQFKALADELLSKENPAAYNQAIMDFGAVQCVPINPDCNKCPMRRRCVAVEKNWVKQLPVKSKKIQIKKRYFHYLVVKEGDYTYLAKRNGKDIWKNLYEFPMVETESIMPHDEFVKSRVLRQVLDFSKAEKIENHGILNQTLSHQKIQASFTEIRFKKQVTLKTPRLIRVRWEALHKFALPGVVREALEKMKSG